MGINYEDELEQVIFDTLKYKYGITDTDILYRYLKLRHRCINKVDKDNELSMLSKFVLDELYISKLTYNDEKIYLLSGYDNSIKNIIESLDFRNQLECIKDENNKEYDFNRYVDITFDKINTYAIKKSKHYKKDKYYKYYLIYNKLIKLNEIFGITDIKEVPKIYGFIQDLNENLSMEEKCLRYIHASNFETKNIKSITEEDLEEFLYKNLHLIEEGLKPIKRQVDLEEGRIDILAKDKNNRFVILELKINEDKHLIWQVMYYPQAIKSTMGVFNPRVITICPYYPNYILNPLKQLDYVEMIEFNATMSNNKIKDINFKKIS